MRHSYDYTAIERALRHHAIEGDRPHPQADRFSLIKAEGGLFTVRLGDEIEHLSPREAWLVALALKVGRDTGYYKVAGELGPYGYERTEDGSFVKQATVEESK